MVEISLRVKELLKEREISQKELAAMANIRESTVSEICRNARTVINFEHL